MINPDIMLDGVNSLAAGIARGFPGLKRVAGYDNGRYAWSPEQWALFPGADHVHISVTASADTGDVLDVETGDATPAQARGWIEMRHAAGLYRPTVYCSKGVVPEVRAATGSLILGKDYDIWVAWYTSATPPPVPPGLPAAQFAAWQYEATTGYDANRVLDPNWPHRLPDHPAPVAAPGGLSATATEARLSWTAIAGVASYRYQVRDGAGNVRQWLTKGTFASVALSGPGPHSWRVQAAGGAWTPWLPVS